MQKIRKRADSVTHLSVLVADRHPVFRLGIRVVLEAVADIDVVCDLDAPADLGRRLARLQPDVVVIEARLALQPDVLPAIVADLRRHRRARIIVISDDPAVAITIPDGMWDAVVPRSISGPELVAVVRDVASRPPLDIARPLTWPAGASSFASAGRSTWTSLAATTPGQN